MFVWNVACASKLSVVQILFSFFLYWLAFLINHSTAYSYAIFASLLEYFVELYFLDFKVFSSVFRWSSTSVNFQAVYLAHRLVRVFSFFWRTSHSNCCQNNCATQFYSSSCIWENGEACAGQPWNLSVCFCLAALVLSMQTYSTPWLPGLVLVGCWNSNPAVQSNLHCWVLLRFLWLLSRQNRVQVIEIGH